MVVSPTKGIAWQYRHNIGGLGVAIVSTSEGLMSDREARAKGRGGEVICVVS
jgi:ribosomal protein S8